jgi:hypothetical protein
LSECRHEDLPDIGQEGRPGHGTVQHHGDGQADASVGGHEGRGFPMPERCRGDETLARGARPWSRVIFVEAPVSSMKTRRSGSTNGCAARQIRRLAATSGRSCSLALSDFF